MCPYQVRAILMRVGTTGETSTPMQVSPTEVWDLLNLQSVASPQK